MLSFFIKRLEFEIRGKMAGTAGIKSPLSRPSGGYWRLLFFPSVGFTDRYHRAQDGIPGLLFQHHLIREHATVPTNVFERFRQSPLLVPEPVPGVSRDV
jgi:hypothetical protein